MGFIERRLITRTLGSPGGGIRIYVRMLGTDVPIPQASVTIRGPIIDTKQTDEGGAYTWPDIPVSEGYLIEIRKPGFELKSGTDMCNLYNQGGQLLDWRLPVDEGKIRIYVIYIKSIGQLPYICQICGLPFSTQQELQSHIQTHPVCPFDGQRFRTQADLDTHMISAHPEETPPGGGEIPPGGGEIPGGKTTTSEPKKPNILVMLGILAGIIAIPLGYNLLKKK